MTSKYAVNGKNDQKIYRNIIAHYHIFVDCLPDQFN